MDFLRPAAGKESQHLRVARQPELVPGLLTRRHVGGAVEEWMTDEGGIDAMLTQQRLLEGQDHCRLPDPTREFLETFGAPRPDLRNDVVQHGHAGRGRPLGDAHVEAGVIDQDDESHLPGPQVSLQPPQHLPVLWDVAHDLDEAKNGEIADVLVDLDSGRLHEVSAHAAQAKRRAPRASDQLARDAGRVQVAGGFAGEKQDLTHSRGAAGDERARRSGASAAICRFRRRCATRRRARHDRPRPSPRPATRRESRR